MAGTFKNPIVIDDETETDSEAESVSILDCGGKQEKEKKIPTETDSETESVSILDCVGGQEKEKKMPECIVVSDIDNDENVDTSDLTLSVEKDDDQSFIQKAFQQRRPRLLDYAADEVDFYICYRAGFQAGYSSKPTLPPYSEEDERLECFWEEYIEDEQRQTFHQDQRREYFLKGFVDGSKKSHTAIASV